MNDDKNISSQGLELIIRWEGLKLNRYICPAGKPTIGVGHVILPNEKFDEPLTRDFAMDLLRSDVKRFEDAIKKHVSVELNQNQFDALVSFLFNVGTGGIINTGVQRAVNSKDFKSVPSKLQEWSKMRVNGVMVVSQGLLNRRKSESELFMRPVVKATSNLVSLTVDSLKLVQSKLSVLNLYSGKIDGIYGPRTDKAIRDFAALKNMTSYSLNNKEMDVILYDTLVK